MFYWSPKEVSEHKSILLWLGMEGESMEQGAHGARKTCSLEPEPPLPFHLGTALWAPGNPSSLWREPQAHYSGQRESSSMGLLFWK